MKQKRISKRLLICVLAVCLVFAGVMSVYAGRQHAYYTWSIDGSSTQSNSHRWQCMYTSNDWYVKSKADTANSGAETTYYKVAPHSRTYAAGNFKCNEGTYRERDVSGNYTYTIGTYYSSFAWRTDSTLNTDIINGKTYLFSR